MNITIGQNDWRLVQQAITQVSEAGGGCVTVATQVTEAHTIFMKSNVRLHLENGCGITGSADYHDYVDFRPDEQGGLAPEKSNCTLVAGVNAHNIAITGAGTLECPGPEFYDKNSTSYGRFFAKPPTPRPRLLHLVNCNDVLLADTLYLNSPCWTIWLSGCQRVSIRGIRIEGDQRMINNDGIDIDSCRDVTVADCHIRTADDCLVLRAMPRNGQPVSVCENVTISNCVLDSACQGMRIGCPSDGVIRNCRMTGLVLNCPGNGIVANN
ncbi:MAG: right-handed parallel beta-helix repeat-containing protein, partial [Victivallales bacterium]|nr:right-handed parallel beta-helix repeat-containing protein [Victivallales bacterium]